MNGKVTDENKQGVDVISPAAAEFAIVAVLPYATFLPRINCLWNRIMWRFVRTPYLWCYLVEPS